MSDIFRVSAKAAILEQGRVLLVRKPNGYWDLPGGKLEADETPEAALRREAREELSLAVRVGRLVHCGVRKKEAGPDVVVVVYLGRLEGPVGEIVLGDEHNLVDTFAEEELDRLTMEGVYRRAIEAAFAAV